MGLLKLRRCFVRMPFYRTLYNARPSRGLATAAETASSPPAEVAHLPTAAKTDPKLNRIVDDISGLTLLQAADLVSLLKVRPNKPSAIPLGAAPAAVEDAAPVEEEPKEKTIFNVTLEKFDAAAKAKIIREIKTIMPSINLAKKFVESVPKLLKENMPKEDAEKLQKTFEALGATVTLS
ncbi:hypothetical protein BS47DRAFT_1399362 [Hydnum rufescens UP504]|uniref:Uncharacterized protein n=1 Tax=Hydnum rufescens UP504 TaxID=1448309 RepID=A0A9P6AKN5_9AGAM|nr:hypothetical protein BS47DRAFT_1399362 [Hydnum rufescens UP504]